MTYYIGLMSGTSADGIDATLVKITDDTTELIAHLFAAFPQQLRQIILTLQNNDYCSLKTLGMLNYRLGCCYAEIVTKLLADTGFDLKQITAIGCHGQTISHHPHGDAPFSMQAGDPNILAEKTQISVVADFRGMDIACGGTGAPLVPSLHQALFSDSAETRVIVNLGGIANMTLLAPGREVTGFDNGPANCLMDGWIHHHFPALQFDKEGQWAATGHVDQDLLNAMLAEPYFHLRPPKSTGKELFNQQWLQNYLNRYPTKQPQDIQATLCELTATVIAKDIMQYAHSTDGIYICGGGACNTHLLNRLSAQLPSCYIALSDDLGIPTNCVEAIAFAWLARCRIKHQAGNIPSVTGAKKPALLGGIYRPYA
ncbi:MAG: anhydro-N-acetylmuramic acid kinase [Endozoicomonadaceae bacterium]|nr:anhydro-N-acetylmuramic acid kinase [Endozoicomonadaceae bacterium]